MLIWSYLFLSYIWFQGLPILFYPEYDYGSENSSLIGLTSLSGYPSQMEQLYSPLAIGQGQVQNQSQSVVNTVSIGSKLYQHCFFNSRCFIKTTFEYHEILDKNLFKINQSYHFFRFIVIKIW